MRGKNIKKTGLKSQAASFKLRDPPSQIAHRFLTTKDTKSFTKVTKRGKIYCLLPTAYYFNGTRLPAAGRDNADLADLR